MPKKSHNPKRARARDGVNDLWIAPRYTMKGPAGERAWENRPGGVPNSSRYLELADIALGLKKPEQPQKQLGMTPMHEVRKTEPYSKR